MPLLTTKWGQEYPYNAKVRYLIGDKTYQFMTGCVATAMAQVMHYHRFPRRGHGSIRYVLYNYQTWRMGSRKIALKGVAYEAVSITGNPKDASVACQAGDGIQITIACSEVIEWPRVEVMRSWRMPISSARFGW